MTMNEALTLVEGLPPAIAADCLPALSLALAEASELQRLASWLLAQGPAEIAGIAVTADGCVLRHLSLSLDSAGWPITQPLDGQTMFASQHSSQILECVRAALAAAAAPAVLLETIPDRRCAMRIEPMDAAAILHALLFGGARRARRDPLPSVHPTR